MMSAWRDGRVLVSVGDPNGIGPEIAVKAALALQDDPALRPIVIGGSAQVEHWARRLGSRVNDGPGRWGRPGIDLHAVDCLPAIDARPGRICAQAGAATVAYLEAAIGLVRSGTGRVIIGCPHSETAINATGRAFAGYPGLIAELSKMPRDDVFLMLIGGGMRIIHATLHESVGNALARLSAELVERAALAGAEALGLLGIAEPRIGLFGINPHAGEGGLFGTEDEAITIVAAKRLRARGLQVLGPEGADVMLQKGQADIYVAMFHDQGHIPIKLLAGQRSAALSVGADIQFSSVGHGAAFDIAGEGVADPAALIQTIRLLGGVT